MQPRQLSSPALHANTRFAVAVFNATVFNATVFNATIFCATMLCATMLCGIMLSGCSDDASLCDDAACSGHGTCAVSGGDTAICLCDPGFHSERSGLSCIENVVGGECTGVDCNMGGVCAVSGGAPICACGEGYAALGPTSCMPVGSACDEQGCSDHGRCAVVPDDRAGPTMGAVCLCDAGYHSEGDGLTCVENVLGDECRGVDCAADGVCAVSGGAPICVCGVGFHAATPTMCVADTPSGSGGACLSSAECEAAQVCERLSGRCADVADVTCGTAGTDPRTGTQGVGGFCVIGSAEETAACRLLIGGEPLDAGSFCQSGLRCTSGSPVGASARVCRAAAVAAGVCREACDPCAADSCATGEACGNVPTVGGVCMPAGFSDHRCGYVPCQAGRSCLTEVSPGEPANGVCSLRCDLETLECPGGMLCDGTGTCTAGHYVDEGEECHQVVDTGVCRPGFACGFSAAGWRCVSL